MERIRPEEISSIIARRIKSFKERLDIADVGEVVEVGDGIAKIYGLRRAMASELVEFPHKIFGLILNLEEEVAGVAIFGPTERIKEADPVRLTIFARGEGSKFARFSTSYANWRGSARS